MLQATGSTAPHPPETPDRAVWIAVFDFAAVAAFALLWSALALRLVERSDELAPALLLALPLGYLLADAISGCVHWFADTCFDEGTPIVGRLLIQPFREHHRDALGITRHGFLEVCGNNCAACLLPLGAAWPVLAAHDGLGRAGGFGLALLLATTVFVSATNAFHRWAHSSDPPSSVAWLQRHRLILSPEHHALHHEGGHDRAYCVTNGWLNPLLDRGQLFQRATRMVRRFTGNPG